MSNETFTYSKGDKVRLKLPETPEMLINMVSKATETKFGTMYQAIYFNAETGNPVMIDVHHNCLEKVVVESTIQT